jgi:hypothetical protein
MLHRCENPLNKQFSDYGGRGIRVCKKWKTFEGFFDDMGHRSNGMTLDRIDNNGNYGKENCKWSTVREQNRNSRHTNSIEFRDEIRCLTGWAEHLGIKLASLSNRIHTCGWTIEEALTTPVRPCLTPNNRLNNSRSFVMEKAVQEFAVALANLIRACLPPKVEIAKAEVVETSFTEETEPAEKKEKREKKDKFPKRFIDWAAGRKDEWSKIACKTWSKEKIEFIVPENMADFVDENIGELVDELRSLANNKGIEILTIDAPKKGPKGVTADEVKEAAAQLANKLKSRDAVKEIIQSFGVAKIDDLPAEKLAECKKALEAARETSPLKTEDENGF